MRRREEEEEEKPQEIHQEIQELPKEQKEKIIKALTSRGAVLPCPRCKNNNFTLIDGYIQQMVQPEFTGGIIIGGPTIPSVVVACTRCGFLSQHALGALGLIPKEEAKNEQ